MVSRSLGCPASQTPKLLQALRLIPSVELGDFAHLRAYLTRRQGAPGAPVLATAFLGELRRRHFADLNHEARLTYAASRLGAARCDVRTLLPSLAERVFLAKDSNAAATLMTAFAHSLAAEATEQEKEVSHQLAELVLKGGTTSLQPAAIASLLRCAERLQLPLAPALLEAAADNLRMALHSEEQLPPRRFGEALAALSELGADLEDVYETLSQRLADNILWWRREDGRTEDFALLFVNRWFFDLLGTRVGQGRAVFDLAPAELLRDRLCKELPDAVRAPGDLARLIRVMEAMTMNRAHRPILWHAFLATVSRAVPYEVGLACHTWLPQLLELMRRSPFARNKVLMETAARMAGPVIQAAPGPELARMLQTLVGLREESFTEAVVQRHAAALEDRLLEPSTLGSARVATLAALANGGGTGVDTPWWRERILRPWGAELRRLVAALRQGPRRLGRGTYESELIQMQLSDVGSRWQPGVLGALGIPSPPRSFVLKGARAVLRHRRQTDASSPWALRALGFLSFRLAWSSGQAVEDGTLIFTAARQMQADEDVELMSVDIGFLDRRYRRHGDVERVALLRTLAALPARERTTVTGTVDLYVDRAVCLSCLGILRQFHELLPKVELRLAVAGPPFFRHFASRQKGGVEREPCRDTSLMEGDIRAWDP